MHVLNLYPPGAFAIRNPTVYNLASTRWQNLSWWSLSDHPDPDIVGSRYCLTAGSYPRSQVSKHRWIAHALTCATWI